MNKYFNNLKTEDAFYNLPLIKNASIQKFENNKKIDEKNLTTLDKWILSELELAQKEITENMENYSLS